MDLDQNEKKVVRNKLLEQIFVTADIIEETGLARWNDSTSDLELTKKMEVIYQYVLSTKENKNITQAHLPKATSSNYNFREDEDKKIHNQSSTPYFSSSTSIGFPPICSSQFQTFIGGTRHPAPIPNYGGYGCVSYGRGDIGDGPPGSSRYYGSSSSTSVTYSSPCFYDVNLTGGVSSVDSEPVPNESQLFISRQEHENEVVDQDGGTCATVLPITTTIDDGQTFALIQAQIQEQQQKVTQGELLQGRHDGEDTHWHPKWMQLGNTGVVWPNFILVSPAVMSMSIPLVVTQQSDNLSRVDSHNSDTFIIGEPGSVGNYTIPFLEDVSSDEDTEARVQVMEVRNATSTSGTTEKEEDANPNAEAKDKEKVVMGDDEHQEESKKEN